MSEKLTNPVIFSSPEPALQARLRPLMEYEGRERGRQRKYHETIALLTFYHKNGRWGTRLDPQMEEYYREHYPEYFGKTANSKTSVAKRAANTDKAKRTRKEALQRERRKTNTHRAVHPARPGTIDLEVERRHRRTSS